MFVKKIKRICDVRKCKNKETYAISRTREAGNSVIICKDCLKEALAEIERLEGVATIEERPKEEEITETAPIEEVQNPKSTAKSTANKKETAKKEVAKK